MVGRAAGTVCIAALVARLIDLVAAATEFATHAAETIRSKEPENRTALAVQSVSLKFTTFVRINMNVSQIAYVARCFVP